MLTIKEVREVKESNIILNVEKIDADKIEITISRKKFEVEKNESDYQELKEDYKIYYDKYLKSIDNVKDFLERNKYEILSSRNHDYFLSHYDEKKITIKTNKDVKRLTTNITKVINRTFALMPQYVVIPYNASWGKC